MSRSVASSKQAQPGDKSASPGLLVRLAAILYDLLLLIAIFFVATAILLPFNSGEAAGASQLIYYRLYLIVISFIFYGWFWTHG
ncbi:MAG: RDD family protein, partial [Methylococcales bacterium]